MSERHTLQKQAERAKLAQPASAGFSAVEILVVVAIIALLATLLAFGLSDFAYRQSFNQIVQEVQLDVVAQRQKSISARSDDTHGVYFSSSTVVYFQGAAYSSTSPSNRIYQLPNHIRATSSLGSGVEEVVFARLTGASSASGTVSLIDDRSVATSTLIITSTGLIQ